MQRLLAEWHPQQAVLLTWPHTHSDWADQLPDIQNTFIDMASAISSYENLCIICYDIAHLNSIQAQLKNADVNLQRIQFYIAPTNDTWIRDYGPLSVKNKNDETMLLKFEFNAWGSKYHYENDNAVTSRLYAQHAFQQMPIANVEFVLEGGSIDTDGEGTLLTTEACLLASTRNPDYSRQQIEELLNIKLGINHYLWLKHGYLTGDDTDSHVDMLARFVNPQTITYVQCTDSGDEHYAALKEMENELQHFRTRDKRPYELVPLPFPKPIFNEEGKRLPASYANFLIINGAVLVPVYNDPADENAIKILTQCFSNRKIIPIQAVPLIHQFGSIHCASMQIAANAHTSVQ